MNIFIQKHSSILNEKNITKGKSIFRLLYKKISNKSFNLNVKQNDNNNNKLIKTNFFNFSTKENFENNNNINNLSENPTLTAENLKTEFNLNLTEEQKINFDAFYDKMKENIDSLVEINKKLKEDSEM